jgi:hypothetical protein
MRRGALVAITPRTEACERALTLLSLREDAPLASADQEWLDAHLEECERCTVARAGLAEVGAAYAALPVVPASADVREALFERAGQLTGKDWSRYGEARGHRSAEGIVAAGVVLVAFLVLAGGGLDEAVRPPPQEGADVASASGPTPAVVQGQGLDEALRERGSGGGDAGGSAGGESGGGAGAAAGDGNGPLAALLPALVGSPAAGGGAPVATLSDLPSRPSTPSRTLGGPGNGNDDAPPPPRRRPSRPTPTATTQSPSVVTVPVVTPTSDGGGTTTTNESSSSQPDPPTVTTAGPPSRSDPPTTTVPTNPPIEEPEEECGYCGPSGLPPGEGGIPFELPGRQPPK